MRVLVTAGNTLAMIDRVRAVTNIFTGRTGATIAHAFALAGHEVRLLTSHAERLAELPPLSPDAGRLTIWPYKTYADLAELMSVEVRTGHYDAVIHAAAVSDYLPVEAFTSSGDGDDLTPAVGGKLKSDAPEMWLRMIRAPKLVDQIRPAWGFTGVLVKFKLEVNIDDAELERVAERSRRASHADVMVANTLEGAAAWALVGGERGYTKVERACLAATLVGMVVKHLSTDFADDTD